jgi:heat shock protein HslJ
MNNKMKKTITIITMFLIPAIFSFADDIPTTDMDVVPFSRIERIDWNLAEVRKTSTAVIKDKTDRTAEAKNMSENIVIDRTKVQREIYSIRFQEGRVHGRGADNIYFAPYTADENNTLSIKKIAGTRMVPLFEMENFSEYDYFQYLEKAYRWEFHDWKLKLFTYDKDNEEAVLEFVPIYK